MFTDVIFSIFSVDYNYLHAQKEHENSKKYDKRR